MNLAVTLTFPLNLALKNIIYDEILATAMGEKDAQVQYDLTFLNPPIMSPSCPMLWYKVSHGHQVFSIVYFVILSLPSDQGEWVCYYCLHTNVSSGKCLLVNQSRLFVFTSNYLLCFMTNPSNNLFYNGKSYSDILCIHVQ